MAGMSCMTISRRGYNGQDPHPLLFGDPPNFIKGEKVSFQYEQMRQSLVLFKMKYLTGVKVILLVPALGRLVSIVMHPTAYPIGYRMNNTRGRNSTGPGARGP